MNKTVIIFVGVLMLVAGGCATSTYTFGRDFAMENVNKIVKGKTTASDLVQMFGEPYSKTVVSDTEEKWLYMYTMSTAKAQSFMFTTKVDSEGQFKTLDILLKDGIVTNFAYTDSPSSGTVR